VEGKQHRNSQTSQNFVEKKVNFESMTEKRLWKFHG